MEQYDTSSLRFRFIPGFYRPIYLWGGPGTIRMNLLKFMNQPVDEAVHLEVHSPEAADLVVNRMGCNWVHLMYDWGFPPEVEQEDWEVFERAAGVYHKTGTQVFAYFQTSNCVYSGSFRKKDWYARDPQGKKVFYYTGRYMTCLNHPEWREHLRNLVRDAIQRGADGVFFDNIWFGAMPSRLFGGWLGGVGCHCSICQDLYLQQNGETIPRRLNLSDPACERFLRWRAGVVTNLVAEMKKFARSLQPGTPISANVYDAVMRNSFLVYGIDVPALGKVLDVSMIENFALPRWDAKPKPRLANNALTIRSARSMIKTPHHLSVLSYDVGIGFDPIYPPRRYRQAMYEAFACQASMTTKGTEYYQDGKHTLITDRRFSNVQKTIGVVNTWLRDHFSLLEGAENLASIGLLHPGDALWKDWSSLATLFFGACQTLLAAGIPFQIVQPDWVPPQLECLVVLDPLSYQKTRLPSTMRILNLPNLKHWQPKEPTIVETWSLLKQGANEIARGLMHAYFTSPAARRLMEAVGMQKLVTQTEFFYLPPPVARKELLISLPSPLYPRVRANQPVLIETWQKGSEQQVHVVNYATAPQKVKIEFGSTILGRVITPDNDEREVFEGKIIETNLDIYKILMVESRVNY